MTVAVTTLLAACSSEPASRDAIAARAEPAGIAPELVHVTSVDGFDLMTQSVGVMGSDGMSAVYLRQDDGATLLLTTAREPAPDVAPCADLPDVAEPVLRCVVERADAAVQIDAEGVEPSTLREAGEAVRVPTPGELERLFADVRPVQGPPVERGDLPPGDGAPDNEPGPGG
jgi:hypothetical protein